MCTKFKWRNLRKKPSDWLSHRWEGDVEIYIKELDCEVVD